MSNFFYFLPIVLFVVIVLFLLFKLVKGRKGAADSGQQYYPESNQLYVGNLPYQVNSEELSKLFSTFGALESARVVRNTKTGRSKGFAFVTFEEVKQAKKALKLNGKEVRGRVLVVRMAKPRDE